MKTENSKTNEPHKIVLNFSQRLDLRSSNKLAALQNLSFTTPGRIKGNSTKEINSKE